jgi:hypothetical protein
MRYNASSCAEKELPRLRGTWYTVSVSWRGMNTGEDKTDTITYEGDKFVQRRGGPFERLHTAPIQTDHYIDEGAASGMRYYQVNAVDYRNPPNEEPACDMVAWRRGKR